MFKKSKYHGFCRCTICDMLVSLYSQSEHIALKHKYIADQHYRQKLRKPFEEIHQNDSSYNDIVPNTSNQKANRFDTPLVVHNKSGDFEWVTPSDASIFGDQPTFENEANFIKPRSRLRPPVQSSHPQMQPGSSRYRDLSLDSSAPNYTRREFINKITTPATPEIKYIAAEPPQSNRRETMRTRSNRSFSQAPARRSHSVNRPIDTRSQSSVFNLFKMTPAIDSDESDFYRLSSVAGYQSFVDDDDDGSHNNRQKMRSTTKNVGMPKKMNISEFREPKPIQRSSSQAPGRPNKRQTVYQLLGMARNNNNGSVNGDGIGSAGNVNKGRSINIPNNHVRCELCLNVIPKEYFAGHCKRKHSDQGIEGTVTVSANVKCDICGLNMHQEHVAKHIERMHGSQTTNKGVSVRCHLCDAYMHIDFMIGHMFRSHKSFNSDQGTAVGVLLDRKNAEQVKQWLIDGTIFFENGQFIHKVI